MGVRGFLISWASLRATSPQAATFWARMRGVRSSTTTSAPGAERLSLAAVGLALADYGAAGYEVRAYDTYTDALRDSAVAITELDKPVLITEIFRIGSPRDAVDICSVVMH